MNHRKFLEFLCQQLAAGNVSRPFDAACRAYDADALTEEAAAQARREREAMVRDEGVHAADLPDLDDRDRKEYFDRER